MPLHVWLPEAHPAAPSHVSALLSGVMIKTGVYGILRTLSFLPPAPASWGLVLGGVGLASALAAITLALGQSDLKRVLAYSSVENVGIVALGLGIGFAGRAAGPPRRRRARDSAARSSTSGTTPLMKGLAFLGAGAIAHAAGTRDLERMGGLLRACRSRARRSSSGRPRSRGCRR